MFYGEIEFTPEGVKEFRKSKGLTQGEFGERLGVSQSMVSQAENNPEKLTVSYVSKIDRAFPATIEDIVEVEFVHPEDLPIFKRIRLALRWVFGGEFRSKRTGVRPLTFGDFVDMHERGEL